jgi:predicted ATPase
MFVLVNYRPEYQHRWSNKTYYTQLRIDPLPAESAEQLLHSLLGNDLGLEPVKRLLIALTEGNPFFLEESVHTLVETKALVGEPGAYRMAKPIESTQVPATVQAVLAARIDGLPSEEKRLLQSASVIGKDFQFVLLQAIAELADEPLRHGLAQLQAAEFLYEASLFPELEYTFKHALTHEVAYKSLLRASRQNCHERIAHPTTGSLSFVMTMGIVTVASLAARVPDGPVVTMTSTLRRASSAATAGRRSGFPSAFRDSMTMFFPST